MSGSTDNPMKKTLDVNKIIQQLGISSENWVRMTPGQQMINDSEPKKTRAICAV